MEVVAYVHSKDDVPLLPMYSYPRVRRFIKSGKAIIIRRKPLTIKLTYDIENSETNRIICGNDVGRTNIGVKSILEGGSILYSAHVETNNKDVPKHMSERKEHRMASRRGERKARQRLAKRHNTTFKNSDSQERILPKCDEPIVNNYIINTEAKFANRSREEGWLTPTARHLLDTLIKSVELAHYLLPISEIVIEITKWDFAKMQNPGIKNWEYQKGRLHGFDSPEDAVYYRQDGKCLMCGCEHIDHYHHVVPRHIGGSESLENRCGLCDKCHDLVHKDFEFENKLKCKQEGLLKKFGALSIMNQVMPYYLKYLAENYENVYVTDGYETKKLREKLGLPKTHCVDAWCIAASRIDTDNLEPSIVKEVAEYESFEVKQFRNQDRAITRCQRERTYKYNGETVAKNRRKRTEQKTDALEDWFEKQVALYGQKEAEKMCSQLKVIKSTRYYNDKNRIMPGATFLYKNKRYVLSGQLSNGAYYRAVSYGNQNFPAKECVILTRNDGLVYL